MNVLDLFSAAAGGWSLGMHRAGFRTIAACEVVEWRRAVYAVNNPDVRLYDDVRTLSADRLVRDGVGIPDVIVGSPPCQDASAANTTGKGVDGPRTGLFFEAVRLVGECRPRWAAFENVPGIRNRGVDRVLGALEALGYAAWPLVVGAGNIGAPHERKRVWIIAADAEEIGRGAWRARGSHCGDPWQADGPRRETSHDGNTSGEQVGRTGFAWADDWHSWNGGLARHLRVGDGLSAGLARECISAYGDAVLPQIPEAIGRAILKVEAALALVRAA